jgi:hypothetical protein
MAAFDNILQGSVILEVATAAMPLPLPPKLQEMYGLTDENGEPVPTTFLQLVQSARPRGMPVMRVPGGVAVGLEWVTESLDECFALKAQGIKLLGAGQARGIATAQDRLTNQPTPPPGDHVIIDNDNPTPEGEPQQAEPAAPVETQSDTAPAAQDPKHEAE